MNDAWREAVEAAYKLGVRDCQEGVDHCFNPFNQDMNVERREAWWKGWMEENYRVDSITRTGDARMHQSCETGDAG